MSGYVPVFGSIATGSLHGRWPDMGLWLSVLAISDWHGVIDVSHNYIATYTGLPLADVVACMKRFCAPDPDSRTKKQDGARLVLIDEARDWGWKVVNHLAYREKARLMGKSEREVESGGNAKRLAHRRDRRIPPNAVATADDRPSYKYETEIKKDDPSAHPPKRLRQDTPEFLEFKAAYPNRAGDQGWRKAERAARARIGEGHSWVEINAGARRYDAFIKASGKEGTEYVKQAATFLGPDKPFLEAWDIVPQLAGKGSSGNGDEPASLAWQALIDAKPRDARSQKALDKIGGWPRVSARTSFDSPLIKREFCNAWREAA
jgi:hypothetical protein